MTGHNSTDLQLAFLPCLYAKHFVVGCVTFRIREDKKGTDQVSYQQKVNSQIYKVKGTLNKFTRRQKVAAKTERRSNFLRTKSIKYITGTAGEASPQTDRHIRHVAEGSITGMKYRVIDG